MTLPEVPPEQGARLEYFLKQIRSAILTLSKAGGDGGDTGGGGSGLGDDTPQGFEPVYETPVTLADEGTGTEDAWTTLASGAPSGSRYAIIIGEVASTDDADVADLKFRTESGAAEIPIVYVDSDEDDASPRLMMFVRLTDSGSFDYKLTNTGATSVDWSITYVGYVA